MNSFSSAASLAHLPDDCLENVFAFLSPNEHVALGATSRRNYSVFKFPGAWPVLDLTGCATDALLALLFADWQLQPEVLSIAESNISDAGLSALAGLRRLTRLDMSRCTRVTDAGVKFLAHLPLRSLSLFCCYRITDCAIASLSSCPLEELSLVSCKRVTDASIIHLRESPIRSLLLTGCAITDSGVAELQHLKNLSSLSLSRCPISNSALGHLSGLPLVALELVSVSISSSGLLQLRSLPLRKLFLKDCAKLSERTIVRCLSGLPLELVEMPSGKRRTGPLQPCVPAPLLIEAPVAAPSSWLPQKDLLLSLVDAMRRK